MLPTQPRWSPSPPNLDAVLTAHIVNSLTQAPSRLSEPVWMPQPGPQSAGYDSPADETFYGGSAGGGKTDLLLGLAGTAHRRSILFRRVFPSIRGLIERSREIFNRAGAAHGKDSYNEALHLWRLEDGRLIEFSHLQLEADKEKHRGNPHDFYGFDEVTEFTESQFRFVTAWNRTTTPGQRCRVVATGNPPTAAEGEWVIRYWAPWLDGQHAHPARPGDLRWFARVDNQDVEREDAAPFTHKGELIIPRSRTFIPARLSDNPILDATGYRAMLQGLPEPLRSQLLYGDFSVGLTDDPWQVIPTAWVRAAQARWREDGRDGALLACLGVDVARGGQDQTVLARRYGPWFAPLEKHPGATTPDGPSVAGKVLAALTGGGLAHIDGIGVGASVYDHVAGQVGARARSVIASASAPGKDRTGTLAFGNLRAWAYWNLREALDPDTGDGLALPPDPELLADLCSPRWFLRATGIMVESKDDLIKRLGRSPDSGDAVMLALLPPADPGLVLPEVLGTLEAW